MLNLTRHLFIDQHTRSLGFQIKKKKEIKVMYWPSTPKILNLMCVIPWYKYHTKITRCTLLHIIDIAVYLSEDQKEKKNISYLANCYHLSGKTSQITLTLRAMTLNCQILTKLNFIQDRGNKGTNDMLF